MAGQGEPGDDRAAGDLVPRPDPSRLTTELVDRALAAYREVVDTRLKGMDRATELVAENVAKTGVDSDGKVEHLREDVDRQLAALREWLLGQVGNVSDVGRERFAAVDTRFEERDERIRQAALESRVSLDAALAAAKEAVCLSIDEPILCADLIWRPAGELRPGDELVAFEEETLVPMGRRYRKATVIANSVRLEPLIRVTTPVGSVRCTPEHPWLAGGGAGHAWHWVKTRDLKPGVKVMHMADVWEVDRSWDAGWLAGILDGEGCLGFRSRTNGSAKLTVSQVYGEVADQIEKALMATGATISRHDRPGQDYASGGYVGRARPQAHWEINGRSDIMRVLGTYRPVRLLANSERVWEGFAIRGGRSRTTKVKVTSVETVGIGQVAALTTTTGTYIGGGFAMHNSEQNKANTLAIGKSEAATQKQIDALITQMATSIKSLEDKIADLKTRVDLGEGRSTGLGAGWGYLVGAIAVVAAVIAVVARF